LEWKVAMLTTIPPIQKLRMGNFPAQVSLSKVRVESGLGPMLLDSSPQTLWEDFPS
jgi:hypothetical protein